MYRAKSISSNCSFDPVALSPHRDRKGGGGGLGLGIGGEISRPTSTLRKKSPGRRKSKAEGDLLNVLAGGQKSGPFSPNDDDYDDDDDYSMDEDDIELDIDFARLGSKEELDTEDEDHYDDGDSDVGTSYHHNKNDSNSMLMISNQHQQYQESIILPEDNKSLIAPYKRRECEDEGEGLKGIEGSKLAPMLRVRASIGGMIGIGSKSSSKNNSNSNSNNNSYTDMKSGNKNKPSSSSSMFLGIRTKSPSLDPSPEVYSCCDAYEVGGGRSGLESAITFGPGASQQHPWTLRKDSGVNSRLLNGQRGDEIYYMGVIDILQQYNMRKRAETLIKVII